MANWIEHTCEPNRLLLAWQAPDATNNRRRFSVGELVRDNADATLRYFENDEVNEARRLGFQGYPAFKLDRREHKGVLSTFMRRLPPRSRPDFAAYIAHFRLPAGARLSDFALLGYTEAKLPSDGFSVVNDLSSVQLPCEFMLEIAGYRHHTGNFSPLSVGEMVELIPEPTNEWDPMAIAIHASGRIVGYINRLQTAAFHNWIEQKSVVATVERMNGTAPRPRAFIFVWVKPSQNQVAA